MTLSAAPTGLAGTILFARYAFMPNKLAYCGGDDNAALFQYCVAKQTDPGLVMILQKFEGAYPYLKLIANSNGIADPFDARVVEAYWIGNELLDRVDLAGFYDHLRDRFASQLSQKTLDLIVGKAPLGARAHHSFHVFDVHSRAGNVNSRTGTVGPSLDTMENCRIGWGRIKEIGLTDFVVEHQPLVLADGKLALGEPTEKRVLRQLGGHGFVAEPRLGDYISIHWNWACDVLTAEQVRNLERYTRYHMHLANQTL